MSKTSSGEGLRVLHPFTLSPAFLLVNVLLALAISVLLKIFIDFSGWLIIVVPLALTLLLLFNANGARDRARKWRLNAHQENVPVVHNWLEPWRQGFFIDRIRHVLVASEERILLVTRRSIWQPIFRSAIGGLVLLLVGVVSFINGWVLSFERTSTDERRVGPRGNKRLKEFTTTELVEVDLRLLGALLAIAALIGIGVMWMFWLNHFYVVTDRLIYPDLKLPPVFLAFMDNNEESYPLSAARKVDNVTSRVGNNLRYGGIKIAFDLPHQDGPKTVPMMPDPLAMVRIINEAILSGAPAV